MTELLQGVFHHALLGFTAESGELMTKTEQLRLPTSAPPNLGAELHSGSFLVPEHTVATDSVQTEFV